MSAGRFASDKLGVRRETDGGASLRPTILPADPSPHVRARHVKRVDEVFRTAESQQRGPRLGLAQCAVCSGICRDMVCHLEGFR